MPDQSQSPESPESHNLSRRLQAIPRAASARGTTAGQTAGAAVDLVPDVNTTGSTEPAVQTSSHTVAGTGSVLDGRLAKVHRVVIERRIDPASNVAPGQEG